MGCRPLLRKEKLHLLPALLIAAENDASPVTYLVLSFRLCGLGGDRACRAMLEEMKREGFIRVERHTAQADLREKVVSLTREGWVALDRYTEAVNKINMLQPIQRGAGENHYGEAAAGRIRSSEMGS